MWRRPYRQERERERDTRPMRFKALETKVGVLFALLDATTQQRARELYHQRFQSNQSFDFQRINYQLVQTQPLAPVALTVTRPINEENRVVVANQPNTSTALEPKPKREKRRHHGRKKRRHHKKRRQSPSSTSSSSSSTTSSSDSSETETNDSRPNQPLSNDLNLNITEQPHSIDNYNNFLLE